MKSHNSTGYIFADLSLTSRLPDDWVLYQEELDELDSDIKKNTVKNDRLKEDLDIQTQESNPTLSKIEKEKLNSRKNLIAMGRKILDDKEEDKSALPVDFKLLLQNQVSLLKQARHIIVMSSVESNPLSRIAGTYDYQADKIKDLLFFIKHAKKISLNELSECIKKILALLPPVAQTPMSEALNRAAILAIEKLLEAMCLALTVESEDEEHNQNDEDCITATLLDLHLQISHLQPFFLDAKDLETLARCRGVLKEGLVATLDMPESLKEINELMDAYCSVDNATQFLTRNTLDLSRYPLLMFLILMLHYPELIPLGKNIRLKLRDEDAIAVFSQYTCYPQFAILLIDTVKELMHLSARDFFMQLMQRADSWPKELKLITILERYKKFHQDKKAMAELGDPSLWSAMKSAETLETYLTDDEHEFIPADQKLIDLARVRFAEEQQEHGSAFKKAKLNR